MSTRWIGAIGATLLFALGCASTSPEGAYRDVAATVHARSGHSLRWDRNTEEDEEARKAVDALLAKELTSDAAVQVALLASPKIRATLEELSIGQADLVQAGLLKNPVFTVGRTAWDFEHLDVNIFAAVEQDFLDILTLPLRKRVAAAQLEATKLEVAYEVLEVASHVRAAFFRAQAQAQIVAMRRLVAEASEAAAEIAKRQHDAGNLNDLALSTEVTLAAQTTLDLRRSEGELSVLRAELDKLMGVWGHRTAWKMPARLPEMPAEEISLDRLESRAIADRLDVGAMRRQVQAVGYALSLAKTTRWTGTVNVSVEAGRLSGSKRISFGPAVALEIPLFDQRQAAIARLEAIQRQSEDELQALAIDVRADVRAARARVQTARSVVGDYTKRIVPLRESTVKFSQQMYDAMLLGVYQLIQAKQAEFQAYAETIDALRDYWIAKSDLELAVGGRQASRTAPPPPTTTTAPPSQHH
jgi:cobalt-zinc-cadmium efflux system outer membrane protein